MSDLKKLVFKALVKEARDFYSLPNDVEADELLEKYSSAAIKTVAKWLDEHQYYPEKLIAETLRKQLEAAR
jgi:hypothetical protein